MTIGEGVRALLRRRSGACVDSGPLVSTEAREQALADRLAGRTAEVITAALVVVDAADSGSVTRTVAAAHAAISVLQILAGDLRTESAAGHVVAPEEVTEALRARISTAIFDADLRRAVSTDG